MKCKPRLTLDEMTELYRGGMSTEEIAQAHGYKNDKYIRERLKQIGLYDNNRIDVGKIRALRKAGWTISAIAFEMATTGEKVKEILEEV